MPTSVSEVPEKGPRPEESVDEEPARSFGWSDMFVHPDDDPRTDGGFQGERATLVGYLGDQRLTLELKCSRLDAADPARRSVAPSNLSLLGLVRHMAGVEQSWFRLRMAGQDAARHFRSDKVVADARDTWRTEVAFAEQYVADAPDLDVVGKDGYVLREVLVHNDRGVRPARRPRRLPSRGDRRESGSVGIDATSRRCAIRDRPHCRRACVAQEFG